MQNLLLLHGALGAPVHFAPYTSFLEKHFTLHIIEFAGHGNAAIPEGGITMQCYIDQVATYCAAKELTQVHVFGYSMGGYAALALALQKPGLIASVLTLATKLEWTKEGALLESRKLDPEIIREKIPQFATQLAQLHGTDKWRLLLPAIAEMMKDLGNAPLLDTEKLAALTIPTQLMVGDKDNMVTLEETVSAAKAIPGGKLAVLPATKHPLELVRPGLVMSLMSDFWQLPS